MFLISYGNNRIYKGWAGYKRKDREARRILTSALYAPTIHTRWYTECVLDGTLSQNIGSSAPGIKGFARPERPKATLTEVAIA